MFVTEVKPIVSVKTAAEGEAVADLFDQGKLTEAEALAQFAPEISALRALAERTPAPDKSRMTAGKKRLLRGAKTMPAGPGR